MDVLQSVLASLLCITLHELSHGYVAFLLGDTTARDAGRLTLNPLKHLDIFGLLMMVVAHVGWAKPVPVNMYRFKNPRRDMAVTALAGPVTNILISIVAFFLYGVMLVPAVVNGLGVAVFFADFFQLTAIISLGYAVFNFIPIPPLDGSKVVFSLFGDRAYEFLMRYERYGFILLYLLVFTNRLNGILQTGISFLAGKFYLFAVWGADLASLLLRL